MHKQNKEQLTEQNLELEKKLHIKNQELEIEAALERVRTRTMAMFKSDELQHVITVIYQQLNKIGIKADHASILIPKLEKNQIEFWTATSDYKYSEKVVTPVTLEAGILNADIKEAFQLQTGITKCYSFEDKNTWWNFMFENTEFRNIVAKRKQLILESPFWNVSFAVTKNAGLTLGNYSDKKFHESVISVIKRFANVFEQAYIRFLDIQNAEKQAREAEIQLALERVRARSLAMHKSDELQQVITVIYEQLNQLDVKADYATITIPKLEKNQIEYWIATPDKTYSQKIITPVTPEAGACCADQIEGFISQTDITKRYSFEEKNTWWNFMFENTDFRNIGIKRKQFILESPSWNVTLAVTKNTALGLGIYSDKEFLESDILLIKRFSNVFEQAYIRFLDLEKAEAQAREAQIEAALEKVRSRSLAMHKSNELQDVINNVYDRLDELDIKMDSVNIDIFSDSSGEFDVWIASPGGNYSTRIHIPDIGFGPSKALIDARENGDELCVYKYSFEEKNKWFNFVFEHTDFRHVPEDRKHYILEGKFWNVAYALSKYSAIQLNSYTLESFPDRDLTIIQRFGKVFEQAYVRFLDIQKAEAQIREAQIEAALEKVRSRSLAMHKSDELQEIITTVLHRINELGITMDSAMVSLPAEDKKEFVIWIATKNYSYSEGFRVPFGLKTIVAKDFENANLARPDYFSKSYSKKEKDNYYIELFEHSDFRHIPKSRKDFLMSCGRFGVSGALSKNSAIFALSYSGKILNKAEVEVLKRFSRVFEQAYVRFLDLQKAEAQVREAQIETALERIRARTMGMQKSEELANVIAHINTEITNLGINTDNTGIITDIKYIKDKLISVCMWFSIPGKTYSHKFLLPFIDQITYLGINDAFNNKKEIYHEIFSKEEKNSYFKNAFKESDLKLLPDERKEFLLNAPAWSRTVIFQNNSGIMLQRFDSNPFTIEENEVAFRFGRVFEQTYTRFLDIQKAEAQAREAIKQASLDRVRGEIASMRTKDDLDRITPLIWKELTALGVPFIRCGVFIMDDVKEKVHLYLSTPDGRSLAAFEMSFDDEGIAKEAVEHWKKKRIFKEFWDKKKFLNFMKNLIDKGKVNNSESYQGSAPPPESLYLNFVPFKQGMLYVGNIAELKHEDLLLVKTLAESFSIAYARYEDFTQLEKAKLETENMLNELKSTQSQLIQSEKMASLGELTAGIAHEIQNPLNFVNNFSEVNSEIIEELKEEIKNGNLNEIENIVNDIAQNEKKINHHGKRAEAIVKSMLQHSRTKSGQKELTNINDLADEYLRLSYHGMRAKDKSFNADFKTEFDESLPKINVIPQDIGRVLLNLINNAFHAVQAPPPPNGGIKNTQNDYKPTVIVKTSYLPPSGGMRGAVVVSVSDNGPGIPSSIKDKIFQPFFTTKPTGQGTGLGLSLSYDIVKAHGGELSVITKEGEGAEFIIQISTN